MPDIRREPILTETFDSAQQFRPAAGSTYIYGLSHEDRSGHVSSWRDSAAEVRCIEISQETQATFRASGIDSDFFLRSSGGLAKLFEGCAQGGRVVWGEAAGS